MKKLLMKLLCACMAISLSLFFIGCVPEEKAANDDSEFRKVYALYAVYAEANGEEPLTYEEWLVSVRGEKGDKGDRGEQGVTPSFKVEYQYLFVSYDEGETWTSLGKVFQEKGDKGDKGDTGAQGEKGDTGAAGKDGADGEDGKSAYEIWLAAGNTGSEADFLGWLKGQAGEKGDKGDKGDTGAQGEKGDTGAAGKDGADGKDGKDGRGIVNVEVGVAFDENGNRMFVFTFYYTDGSCEIMCVPFGSSSDPSEELKIAREEAISGVNNIWRNFVDETGKGDMYLYIYESTVSDINKANDIQLINSLRNAFENNINGIRALLTQQEETLQNMDTSWGYMLQIFPAIPGSEYTARFDILRSKAEAATSLNELVNAEKEFNAMIGEIRDKLEIDMPAYKNLARQFAEEEWEKIGKQYPDASGNEDYLNRYNDILNSIDGAETIDDVEKAMSEFDYLTREIKNSQPGGELEAYITGCLNEVKAKWEAITNMYSAYINDDIIAEYDCQTNFIRGSLSTKDADVYLQKCLDWLADGCMNAIFESAKDVVVSEVERVWSDLPEEIKTASDYIDCYKLTIDAINGASTIDEIEMATNNFRTTMIGATLEIERANYIAEMEEHWAMMLRIFPTLSGTGYVEQYNALRERVGKAETSDELYQISEEYWALVANINEDENVAMDVNAYIDVCRERLVEIWQDFVARYPRAESDDELIAECESALELLGKASTQDEVDHAANLFVNAIILAQDAYELEAARDNNLLWAEQAWNNLNERFPGQITEEMNAQYTALVDALRGAETIEELNEATSDCSRWLTTLERELDGQGQDEELSEYKQTRENEFTYYGNDRLSFVQDASGFEFVLPESAERLMNRAFEFIESASTMSEVDDVFCKYYEAYKSAVDSGLGASLMSRIKNFIEEKRSGYETDGLASYVNLCSAYSAAADFIQGIIESSRNSERNNATYWAKEVSELKHQLESFSQNPLGNDVGVYVQILYICRNMLENIQGTSVDFSEYEWQINVCSSLEEASKFFDEAMNLIEEASREVRVRSVWLSESWFRVTQGTSEEEFIQELVDAKKLCFIVEYTNGEVMNIFATRETISISLDLSQVGSFSCEMSCNVGDERYVMQIYVRVDPADMSNATLIGSYKATGALEEDMGETSYEFYDNGFMQWNGSFYPYESKGEYEIVTMGNEVYLFTLRTEETAGVEIRYLIDYYNPASDYEFVARLDAGMIFGEMVFIYGPADSDLGNYIAGLSYMQTPGEGDNVGKTTFCDFDPENKTFYCRTFGMEDKDVYTWGDDNVLIRDIRGDISDLIDEISREWDDLCHLYDCSAWEGEYNTLAESISTETEQYMLSEYRIKFDELVFRIRNSYSVTAVTPDFPTYLSVDEGADVEAFIAENFVGKTLTVTYNSGAAVSVKVTRDMVSIDGDFSVSGNCEGWITFVDSFDVKWPVQFTVMINETPLIAA